MAKKSSIPKDPGNRLIAENKKAYFNYDIEEKLECGIELKGTEVKSIKAGKISFPDSFCLLQNNELFIQGLTINLYDFGNINNHDPNRKKKLLAHKQEIQKMKRKIDERGYSIIPLRFYLVNGKVKVQIGIGRGKKLHDKRSTIKERDLSRDIQRELKK